MALMVSQIAAKVDPGTGELTDQGTRDFIATQLRAFGTFARRK